MNNHSTEWQAEISCPQGNPHSQIQLSHSIHSNLNNPQNFNTMNTFKTLSIAIIAIFAFVFSANIAFGQNTVNADLFTYPHALNNVSPEGDTIRLELELGSEAESIESALGYEVSIHFPNWTGEPASVEINAGESWLGGSAQGSSAWSYDSDETILTISYSRNDGVFQTGTGVVAEVTIMPQVAGLSMSDKDSDIEIGVITLENVGFKTANGIQNDDLNGALGLQVYPNPASSNVHIQADVAAGQVRIFDLNGKTWYVSPSLVEEVNVENLPAGLYILEVNADGQSEKQRLVIL